MTREIFSMTKGLIGTELFLAKWKAPFLKGNKLGLELRVPSGKKKIEYFDSVSARLPFSLMMRMASSRFARSIEIELKM